jgi:predicted porin
MDMRLYHFLIIIVIVTLFTNLPKSSGNEIQLTASLALQAEYDDNIFFNDTDTDELEDYISTISPQLKYTQDNPRLNMELAGQIDSINYADNDELNDIDQNIGTVIRYRLIPRMSISGAFDYVKDSRPDRDIETTGLLLNSSIRYSRFFTFTESYDHSENTVSSLTYNFEDQDFEDPELVDFDTHVARLAISHNIHRFLPMTRARFNLDFIRYEYPELIVNYYSTTLGASHEITDLYTLLVDFGTNRTRNKTENDTSPTLPIDEGERETGFTGQFSLSYRGELIKSLLSFSHDLSAASGRSAITERTSFIFDISRRFTSELRGSFKVRYYLNQAEQGALATEDIDTRTLSIIPGIRYEITNNIFFEVFYTYSKIEDRQDDAGAKRNLFFMRLIGHYPFFE